jgi:hypothetical protein
MISEKRPNLGICTFRAFASESECKEILTTALSNCTWAPAQVGIYENDLLVEATVDAAATTAYVTQGFEFSLPIIEQLKETLISVARETFGIKIARFSKVGISRCDVGSAVGRHRDTETYSTKRLVTVILYLNSGFQGGHLYFPDLEIDYSPECGDAIMFLSEHFHLVRPILSGTRYCLIFFGEMGSP